MPDDHHIPVRTLREYRHGQLPPSAMLTASDHLADCVACRQALAQIDSGPAYDELAAAVDGVLDPAAQADLTARLADAPAAAAELAALQQFKQEMAPQAGRVYGPSAPPANDGAHARRVVKPPVAAWRSRKTSVLAAAAAVALLLLGGWWMSTGPRSSGDGAALLTDRDGRRAELADLSADLRESLDRTLRTGQHKSSANTALRPAPARLAGSTQKSTNAFRVLAPVGVAVRDVRPTLHWVPMPDAVFYIVTLAGLDGTDARSSPELPGAQTVWTPPEPLLPGTIYTWQVEALRAGETLAKAPVPPDPEARFQVLSDSQREELARVEARFGRFPFVMAVAYTRAGLEEAAAGQWAQAAREHPDSALAQRLWRESMAAQSPSPIKTKGAQ